MSRLDEILKQVDNYDPHGTNGNSIAEAKTAILSYFKEMVPEKREQHSLSDYTTSAQANYDTGKIVGFCEAIDLITKRIEEEGK